jgi:hypothetical protein
MAWLLGTAACVLVAGSVALGRSSTAPGWLRPVGEGLAQLLHTIAGWARVDVIGAAAAVAALPIPFIIWWLERRKSGRKRGGRRAQQRLQMLARVRSRWVDGFLTPSLADAPQLTLGLRHRPDAVVQGDRARYPEASPSARVPGGISVSQEFRRLSGGILILGEAGAIHPPVRGHVCRVRAGGGRRAS